MLQSRHPKHRRWYFFGPYLESLEIDVIYFCPIPLPPLVAIVMGFSAGSVMAPARKTRSQDHRNTHRFVASLSWWVEEVIYEACVFKADQFDSHLPTWMNSFCLTILLKKTFLLHYEQAELGDLAVWFYELPTKTSQTWISAHQKTSPSKTTTIHQALFLVWQISRLFCHVMIWSNIASCLPWLPLPLALSLVSRPREADMMERRWTCFWNGIFWWKRMLHISNFKYWHFSTVEGATHLISWYVDSLFRLHPILDNALRVSNILSVVMAGIETVIIKHLSSLVWRWRPRFNMATTASGNPIKRFTDSGEADRLSCPTCKAKAIVAVFLHMFRRRDEIFYKSREEQPMCFFWAKGSMTWNSVLCPFCSQQNYCVNQPFVIPEGLVASIPNFLSIVPSQKRTVCTWKWMVGRQSFPFGPRPIFRGELLVSGRAWTSHPTELWPKTQAPQACTATSTAKRSFSSMYLNTNHNQQG